MNYYDVVEKVLFTEKDIKMVCKKLADQISIDYADKKPILVCTLKGSFMFFSDLVREISCDISIEYIKASSYINTQTTENVKISSFMNFDVKGRDVLVVEDIVDSGYTVKKLCEHFSRKGAKSIEFVSMLDKPSNRKVVIDDIKYVGFVIPNYFVIGYGLDYNESYRNLNYIGIINPKYIK